MEEVTISLPPDIVRSVERAVAAGDYASRDAAVGAALRDWADRRELPGYSPEELKVLVRDGLASGFVPHISMDEITVEGRRRMKALQDPG